jgi:hypothetical protein
MSSPLFRTEGFVYRAGSRIYDDEEDEDWVDRSLLTSPLDRSFGENPFEAGPSTTSFTNSGIRHSPAPSPKSEQEEPEEEIKPDIDDLDDIREDTPLREIDPDDLDAPEPEDERQCRICFSGREEEAALGRLISPCLCTGSVRVSVIYSNIAGSANVAVCSWCVFRLDQMTELMISIVYQCLERQRQ